jgi:hypothetical protein
MTERTAPSAAQALYGHLKTGTPDVVERRRELSSVADAMYSHLRPPPPTPTNPYRESLLRGLRELNAKIDARMRREASK